MGFRLALLALSLALTDAYVPMGVALGRAPAKRISSGPRMALAYDTQDTDGPLSESSQGRPGEIIRDYVPKPGAKWRFGKPDYTAVNQAYFEGRRTKWQADSLEGIVQKVIKNWEVEAHHLGRVEDWKTMDVPNFKAYSNGVGPVDAQTMANVGPYNLYLGDMPESKCPFFGSKESFESSNEKFTGVFTEGFPFEVVEVFSGPPTVSLTWRHWGKATGQFQGIPGEGQTVEMYGSMIAKVTDDLVIQELQVFFDRESFMAALAGTQTGFKANPLVRKVYRGVKSLFGKK